MSTPAEHLQHFFTPDFRGLRRYFYFLSAGCGQCRGRFTSVLNIMNRKRILLVLAALILCGARFYFYAGHATSPGQPTLAVLSSQNFTTLASAFNTAKNEVRVVLLLSPT